MPVCGDIEVISRIFRVIIVVRHPVKSNLGATKPPLGPQPCLLSGVPREKAWPHAI
jgi:hypothetical protein